MTRVYRRRLYNNYVTNHLSHTRLYNVRMYELMAKSSWKLFGPFLPQDKNAAILDVGCGAGEFLYMLQKMGYVNAGGIETGLEQIAAALSVGVRNIVRADIFHFMPNKRNCYDMVSAHDVLEHLDRDECFLFLDLCRKALKTEGKILISTINAQSLFGARMRYSDLTHETGFTPGSLAQLLSSADYADIQLYEKAPQVVGVRSFVRRILWNVFRRFLAFWLKIEEGTGQGYFSNIEVYTEAMFVIASVRKTA